MKEEDFIKEDIIKEENRPRPKMDWDFILGYIIDEKRIGKIIEKLNQPPTPTVK